jgi:phenol 2-monooxygenase
MLIILIGKLYKLNEMKVALHQGAIESIFLDSMRALGVEVERSTAPTSIEISNDENELADPASHPVRVALQKLDVPEGQPQEEIVHAKYVVGADGAFQRYLSDQPNHFLL